jgi:hypothetical protein
MKAPRRSARSPYSPSLIEQLESRQLLAVTLADGVLTVSGSSRADNIKVTGRPGATGAIIVKINNGAAKSFSRADVDFVNVSGKAGNDRITVGGVVRGLTISAGSGDDVVKSGGSADLILGGSGDDDLFGRNGNDQIYGEAGDDSVIGGNGNDTLGGDDEDILWARNGSRPADIAGDDTVNGGFGDDWLLSGIESDFVDDDSGNDQLTGGPGKDVTDIRGRHIDDPDTDDDDDIVGLENGEGDTITDEGTDDDIIPVNDVTGPIPNGEDDYSHHKHAFIKIFLEDANGTRTMLEIPSNAGEFLAQPVVHTHENPAPLDARGFLMHFHNTESTGGESRVLTLGDFFQHWGISFSSANLGRFRVDADHTLTMTVQVRGAGAFITPAQNFNNYAIATNDADFADSTKYDQIVIVYKTLP